MHRINLPNGMVALLDDDYPTEADIFHWTAKPGRRTWYATASYAKNKSLYLHDMILPPRPGLMRDHRNGNGLDCRRENLRYVTPAQNQQNAPRRADNNSGYRGVHKQKNGWVAQIRVNGRRIYLGHFKTAEEAAAAYGEASRLHHGEYGRV